MKMRVREPRYEEGREGEILKQIVAERFRGSLPCICRGITSAFDKESRVGNLLTRP